MQSAVKLSIWACGMQLPNNGLRGAGGPWQEGEQEQAPYAKSVIVSFYTQARSYRIRLSGPGRGSPLRGTEVNSRALTS
jgi:hypothetical protein